MTIVSSVAHRQMTHDILMRIHEHPKPIVTAPPEHIDHVVDVLVVILLWTGVFDGFPGKYEAQCVPAPSSQSAQMDLCRSIEKIVNVDIYS